MIRSSGLLPFFVNLGLTASERFRMFRPRHWQGDGGIPPPLHSVIFTENVAGTNRRASPLFLNIHLGLCSSSI